MARTFKGVPSIAFALLVLLPVTNAFSLPRPSCSGLLGAMDPCGRQRWRGRRVPSTKVMNLLHGAADGDEDKDKDTSTELWRPRTGHESRAARLPPAAEGAASHRDWRNFRARLVAGQKGGGGVARAAWAYNAGNVVEQGSLLLGGTEIEYGFGLRQQHFHKSVLLILSHTSDFTRAVILNRPTNRCTPDGWRIWFGGDIQGIAAPPLSRRAVCLHTRTTGAVVGISEQIVDGVFACSFEEAAKCVKLGHARPADFILMVGYAGWGPGQLQKEIDVRSSWHVAAVSPPLISDLISGAPGLDPNDGVSLWHQMMDRIGLCEKAERTVDTFEDRMLTEWVRVHANSGPWTSLLDPMVLRTETLDKLLRSPKHRSTGGSKTLVGTVLRAASTSVRLDRQFLHKALLLVLWDTQDSTIAVVLNRPTTKTMEIKAHQVRGKSRRISFGGDHDAGPHWSTLYTEEHIRITHTHAQKDRRQKGPFWSRLGSQAIFLPGDDDTEEGSCRVVWLCASDSLRAHGIGSPVISDSCAGQEGLPVKTKGVVLTRCWGHEAVEAIRKNIAKPQEFLLVRGFCFWNKQGANDEDGKMVISGGLQAEIGLGHFDVLNQGLPRHVWEQLLSSADPYAACHQAKSNLMGTAAWEATALQVLLHETDTKTSPNQDKVCEEKQSFDPEDQTLGSRTLPGLQDRTLPVTQREELAEEALIQFVRYFLMKWKE